MPETDTAQSGTAWLEDVKAKWLGVCGYCDAGEAGAPCMHPPEDYRPVMLCLVEQVERLARRLAARFEETEQLRSERDNMRAAAQMYAATVDDQIRIIGDLRAEVEHWRSGHADMAAMHAEVVASLSAVVENHTGWRNVVEATRALVAKADGRRALLIDGPVLREEFAALRAAVAGVPAGEVPHGE